MLYTVLGLLPDSYWDGPMRDSVQVTHVTTTAAEDWVDPCREGALDKVKEAGRRQIADEHFEEAAEDFDDDAERLESKLRLADDIEVLAVFIGHHPSFV